MLKRTKKDKKEDFENERKTQFRQNEMIDVSGHGKLP